MRAVRTVARVGRHKALVVFSGMCLSMAIGIGFQSFVASELGTTGAADAFYLGTTVPTLLATAILGAAPNALIRLATETPTALRLSGRGVGARLCLIGAIASIFVAVLGAAMHVGALPVLGTSERSQVGMFLLLASPVPILSLLAALGAVLALAQGRFMLASYGGAFNGAGLFASALLLSSSGLGIIELAVAVDCGYVLQLAVLWPLVRTVSPASGATPEAVARSFSVRAPVAAFLLLLVASSVYKAQPVVERATGAVLGSGIPSALGYADKITSGFLQLATFGFALAALPMLSRDLVRGLNERAVTRLQSALEATAASTIAVVAFGLISAGDMVQVLYERGEFGAEATSTTRTLVLWALPSVAFSALAGPLVAAEYAAGNVRAVATVGLVGFLVGTLATVCLGAVAGYRGVVAGTAMGFATTFVAFVWRAGRVLDGWSWHRFVMAKGPALAMVVGSTAVAALLCSRIGANTPGALLENIAALGARLVFVFLTAMSVLMMMRWRATALAAGSSRAAGASE